MGTFQSLLRFFVHRVFIGAVAFMLFAGKLTQQLSHDLRALICLLLDLTFADSVERPEEPHLLQVADERLQVLCGFDLWKGNVSDLSDRVCCQDVQECVRLTKCDVSTCIWNCRLAVVLRSVLVTYE